MIEVNCFRSTPLTCPSLRSASRLIVTSSNVASTATATFVKPEKPKTIMDSHPMMREVLMNVPEKDERREAMKWYERLFHHIVPLGKPFRVMTIVDTFEKLVPDASYEDTIRAHAVELGLREEYAVYEENEYRVLKNSTDAFCAKYKQIPRSIFDRYLNALFGRHR